MKHDQLTGKETGKATLHDDTPTEVRDFVEGSNAPRRSEIMSGDQIEKELKKDAALEKAFALNKRDVAPYKIEVMLGKGRTLNGPNKAAVLVWESGKRMHGGGDQLMYQCMPRDLYRLTPDNKHLDAIAPNTKMAPGCGHFIPNSFVSPQVTGFTKDGQPKTQYSALCPFCGREWPDMGWLTSERYGRWTMKVLSEILADIWVGMNEDPLKRADIYLKYHESDIRVAAMASAETLEKARQLKGLQIYLLNSILKDTVTGKSVARAIQGFLQA